ncbi:MAG: hypothetical protein GX957_08400, partial [Clostridiaceae bacterium]|nr:hypothetical protein [Clostridiaceae bacterium]
MCKYCDEYMDIPVEVFRTYHDNNANIKVYIEWHGLHIECKTLAKPRLSHTIKKNDLEKIQQQAFEAGKEIAVLAFDFG